MMCMVTVTANVRRKWVVMNGMHSKHTGSGEISTQTSNAPDTANLNRPPQGERRILSQKVESLMMEKVPPPETSSQNS